MTEKRGAPLSSAVPDRSDRGRGPARAEAAAVPAAMIEPGSAPSISELPAGPVAQLVRLVPAAIARAAVSPLGEVWRLSIDGEKSVAVRAMLGIFGMHHHPEFACLAGLPGNGRCRQQRCRNGGDQHVFER